MKYKLISIVLVLFLFLIIFIIDRPVNSLTKISEEVSPIREGDKIVGLNYLIKINKGVKDKTIKINTSILDGINHYKNINSLDHFYIDLKVDNDSKYSYLLKDILITNNKDINRKISYTKNKRNNFILIKLTKSDLISFYDNSYIQIILEK